MTTSPDAWLAVPAVLSGPEPAHDADTLCDRAVAGEQSALREVYERHAPGIHRFLRDLVRCEAAAADATQETFARAFRRLSTLRQGDSLRPWLFGIARNVSLEHGKARRRAPLEAAPRATHVSTPREHIDALDPEVLLLGREAAAMIGRALARMPEGRRAALLLRVDHGLAYEDIARLMAWSLAKTKVEIHRARRILRATLADQEDDAS